MRVFDPPFIPDFGLLSKGSVLGRGDIPELIKRTTVQKAGRIFSGEIFRQGSEMASQKIVDRVIK